MSPDPPAMSGKMAFKVEFDHVMQDRKHRITISRTISDTAPNPEDRIERNKLITIM